MTRNFFFFFPPLPPSLQVGTDVIRSVDVVSRLVNIVLRLGRVSSWPEYIILLPQAHQFMAFARRFTACAHQFAAGKCPSAACEHQSRHEVIFGGSFSLGRRDFCIGGLYGAEGVGRSGALPPATLLPVGRETNSVGDTL